MAGIVLAGLALFGYGMTKEKNRDSEKAESKSSIELSEAPAGEETSQTKEEDGGTKVEGETALSLAQEDPVDEDIWYTLADKCEKGEWVEVDSVENADKKLKGMLTLEFPEDENSEDEDGYYTLQDKKVVSKKEEILDFFEDKEVEAEAVVLDENDAKISKIKCTGRETDKELISFRQDVMKYVNDHINDISPEKGKWEVFGFWWPDDKHIYVEYEASMDSEESDEASAEEDEMTVESYVVLLEVSKSGDKVNTKEIGFFKTVEDEWKLEKGTDPYEDAEYMDLYEFDDQVGKWTKY